MKTIKLLTLAALMGIAGQVTAQVTGGPQQTTTTGTETPALLRYGTEVYTTGGPQQTAVTGTEIPAFLGYGTPEVYTTGGPQQTAVTGTETPALLRYGTEVYTTGGPQQTTSTVVSGGPQQTTTTAIAIGQTIETAGTNLFNQIETSKQATKDKIATALDTTTLDSLTKSAINTTLNTQIEKAINEIKNAYQNYLIITANALEQGLKIFNDAVTDAEKVKAAQDLGSKIQGIANALYIPSSTSTVTAN